MAFWPFMVGATAALTVIGIGNGRWHIPAIALAGYAATRTIVMTVDPALALDEVLICTVWLSVGAAMMCLRGWLPGALFVLSGLTYPAFVVFGVHIGWLSASNVLAEAFAIAALASIGGGYGGIWKRNSNPLAFRHIGGFLDWLALTSLGVASHQRRSASRVGKA